MTKRFYTKLKNGFYKRSSHCQTSISSSFFVASSIALLGIIYALVRRLFTNIWVPGWTALFIGILFMGGVQLICLGIIGETISRICGEVKRRPLYLLEKTWF
jgi:hypothetical protein